MYDLAMWSRAGGGKNACAGLALRLVLAKPSPHTDQALIDSNAGSFPYAFIHRKRVAAPAAPQSPGLETCSHGWKRSDSMNHLLAGGETKTEDGVLFQD